MKTITYLKLTDENFNCKSLDEFIRYQEVSECWQNINNELLLVPNDFIEDWDLKKRRDIAKTILSSLNNNGYAYGAYFESKLVGYIYLSMHLFGSKRQYTELKLFHVSEPFRRKGIGKELFKAACLEAKKMGAEKLYISAHSSKESQAAYRSLGCVEAEEVDNVIAESEPFDIQMEYII